MTAPRNQNVLEVDQVFIRPPPTKYCNLSCLHVFNAIDFHNTYFQHVLNDYSLG